MGGTALKHLGFESRRISKEEYLEIVFEIREIGRKHFSALEDILHYNSKLDYGDIDFVCLNKPPLGEITNFKEIFGAKYYSQNSCVHSFDYKGVQIDIAVTNTLDSFTYYYLFSCFSPMGNVIGRLVKQKGLKWGIDGITYPIKLSDSEQLGNVKVGCIYSPYSSFDNSPYATFNNLLQFLGLENNFGFRYERFKTAFETQEDIFKWLSSSKLFNKDIFAFENLNHVNRKRDRVRKDYHSWLEYIKDKPNKFVGNEDKTVYIKEINNHFHCDINKEAEDLIAKHSYKKFLKEKFNGKMVSEWTGLQGEELGKVIKSYKDSIGDFDNFIQLKTTQNIEKNFREFFKSIS